MSAINYVQLPPDGTGKKSKHTVIISTNYSNGTIDFQLGDTVTTDDGFLGSVVRIDGGTVSGNIHCVVDHDSTIVDLVDGSDLKVDGVPYAEVSGTTDSRFNQDIVITGGNNPLNKVTVSDQGALYVQNPTGTVLFDAFGKTMTSESTTIREYQPSTDTLPDEFSEYTTGTASIDWNPTRHVVAMSCGTNAGDSCIRRTNLYHKYQTGVSTTVLFSAFVGDAKYGVERRLGIFDDNDGLYFDIVGLTMNVAVRSSVTGSIVENVVPQSEWNVDRLDGSEGDFNISRHQLNPLAAQVMFIDYQWLGAGRVRFGFVIDGDYIVCHEFRHANNISNPYMRTGTLPLTFEQTNYDATASPSFLYTISAAVKCEGKFSPREHIQAGFNDPPIQATDHTTFTHLMSLRSVETLNGQDNRSVAIPITVHCTEVSGSNDAFLLEMVKNDTLGGTVTWVDPYPDNALESTNAALGGVTSTTGGEVLMTCVIKSQAKLDLSDVFSLNSQLMIRKADITEDPDHISFRIRPIVSGGDVTVSIGMTWREYR